jgi:seryl-tRNA synthetase
MEPLLLPDRHASGIYGRGAVFEHVLDCLTIAIGGIDPSAAAEVVRFPPLVSRMTVERCGYLHYFPHLLGTVHSFTGTDREHARLVEAVDANQDWGAHQTLSDLVLTPAACYAAYPHLSGTLPADGRLLDVESWCFRQEATRAPSRMRSFRMREFVRLGQPEPVQAWRDTWMQRGLAFLTSLGLAPSIEPASDPFFGVGGRLLAVSQSEQALKFELIVDLDASTRVAVMSCNYHLEHFGEAFGIGLADGRLAHTACVGFGLERLALALLGAHGALPRQWPAGVRAVLGMA